MDPEIEALLREFYGPDALDAVTGQPMAMTPIADPSVTPRDTRSLGSRVGNQDLATARELVLGQTNLYDLLPESYRGGVMDPLNRGLGKAATGILGMIMGAGGLASKGMGYGFDVLGLDLRPSDIPNTEEMGQIADALYALPTSRALGGLFATMGAPERSAAAARAADQARDAGQTATDYAKRFAADESGAIKLWHGSPHDFEAFDMSKIGSGEGAQDLGRGFSLTDQEAIAHLYTNPASRWGDLAAMERYSQAGPGRYYNVVIDAEPSDFLDWNKPWRDQVKQGTPLFDALKAQEDKLLKIYGDDPAMVEAIPKAKLSRVWPDNAGLENAATQSGYVGNLRANFSGDTEYTVFDPSRMQVAKKFDKDGNEIPLSPSLPTPTTPDEQQAQGVLDLLTSGRASEVTDEMLDLGDPTLNARLNMYLFENYDLPMDEASRMARAREAGFDTSLYHGTFDDIRALDRFKGSAEGGQGAFFSTDEARVANTYAPWQAGRQGQNVTPLLGRAEAYGEAGYRAPFPADGTNAEVEQWLAGLERFNRSLDHRKPDYFEGTIDAARRKDAPGAIIRQVEDDRIGGMMTTPSDVYITLDPTTLRSRFARFDPRLSLLRNLSAGVGGLGLLTTQMPAQSLDEEIRQYLESLQ